MRLTKQKGFTLIELMIVVAIIGILAAVAIPKFADLVTKSKEASVKGSIGSVRSAVSIYYGDSEGEYPTNLYAGLTSGNKYLDSVTGLGNFTIPKVTTQSNPGHPISRTLAANVSQGDGTTIADSDNTLILYYINTNTRIGETLIKCTHNDTKGNPWTSI